MRADLRNGISQYELKPPAGLTHTASEVTLLRWHQPLQKKSPTGASTEGVLSPSQYMRTITRRQKSGNSVSQICWIAPGPSISATVNVVCAGMLTLGDTFHPWPSSRATCAPVPSVAMPPLPFSPVKFSALIERVLARDRRDRLPRLRCSPLNGSVMVISSLTWV